MTVKLSVEDCRGIYDQSVCAGSLADLDRLAGAVEAPYAGFGDEELFPSLHEKAARLAFGIAQAQAYTDGNKRLAWLCTVAFLAQNGQRLTLSQDAAAEAILGLADRSVSLEDLTILLLDHMQML